MGRRPLGSTLPPSRPPGNLPWEPILPRMHTCYQKSLGCGPRGGGVGIRDTRNGVGQKGETSAANLPHFTAFKSLRQANRRGTKCPEGVGGGGQ